jgi:hypothetical protein
LTEELEKLVQPSVLVEVGAAAVAAGVVLNTESSNTSLLAFEFFLATSFFLTDFFLGFSSSDDSSELLSSLELSFFALPLLLLLLVLDVRFFTGLADESSSLSSLLSPPLQPEIVIKVPCYKWN